MVTYRCVLLCFWIAIDKNGKWGYSKFTKYFN